MLDSFLKVKDYSLFTETGRLLAEDINCSLGPNEVLWIVGDNGSGKTTIVNRMLWGNHPPLKRVKEPYLLVYRKIKSIISLSGSIVLYIYP